MRGWAADDRASLKKITKRRNTKIFVKQSAAKSENRILRKSHVFKHEYDEFTQITEKEIQSNSRDCGQRMGRTRTHTHTHPAQHTGAILAFHSSQSYIPAGRQTGRQKVVRNLPFLLIRMTLYCSHLVVHCTTHSGKCQTNRRTKWKSSRSLSDYIGNIRLMSDGCVMRSFRTILYQTISVEHHQFRYTVNFFFACSRLAVVFIGTRTESTGIRRYDERMNGRTVVWVVYIRCACCVADALNVVAKVR